MMEANEKSASEAQRSYEKLKLHELIAEFERMASVEASTAEQYPVGHWRRASLASRANAFLEAAYVVEEHLNRLKEDASNASDR